MRRSVQVSSRRLLSSSAIETPGYSSQRQEYRSQMHELRKRWKEEITEKNEKLLEFKAAEKRKLILEKAIRLREKRQDSAIRQEQARKAREAALDRYERQLTVTKMYKEKIFAEQQSRYVRALQDLERESSVWVNKSNVDNLITEQLFATPTTTGIVTRYSEHWRYNIMKTDYKRIMSGDLYDQLTANSALTNRLNMKAQSNLTKRLFVEDFLDQMIGTGEERGQYKDLVDKFVMQFGKMEALTEVEQYYDLLLDNMNENERSSMDGILDDDDEEDDDDPNDYDLDDDSETSSVSSDR